MTEVLKTVLLLALPASGKSEVRRYLKSLDPELARTDFHMGASVQLDDYPYVHLMRVTDDALEALGKPRLFFAAPDRSFFDARDWGTLIELLNEDYDDLVAERIHAPPSAATLLFERFDRASAKVGLPERLSKLDAKTRTALVDALEKEAAAQLRDKHEGYPDTLEGKTLVIEFARGGRQGAPMPLDAPYGYRHSIGRLSPAILASATILYIWVTPEESRRKNVARTDPNDPGSILHHGVPHEVMIGEYGCDDMDWLEAHARKPGTIPISSTDGQQWDVPIARFDNRVDKTTFIRDDRSSWKESDVRAVHDGLRQALSRLSLGSSR
jgi:hypothetical protein